MIASARRRRAGSSRRRAPARPEREGAPRPERKRGTCARLSFSGWFLQEYSWAPLRSAAAEAMTAACLVLRTRTPPREAVDRAQEAEQGQEEPRPGAEDRPPQAVLAARAGRSRPAERAGPAGAVRTAALAARLATAGPGARLARVVLGAPQEQEALAGRPARVGLPALEVHPEPEAQGVPVERLEPAEPREQAEACARTRTSRTTPSGAR